MKLLLSSVAETLPEVCLFLEKLSASVKAGTIRSKEQLIERCQEFYTAEHMAEIEAVIPGWKHMASFEHGRLSGTSAWPWWHCCSSTNIYQCHRASKRFSSGSCSSMTWQRNRLAVATTDTASAQQRTRGASCRSSDFPVTATYT